MSDDTSPTTPRAPINNDLMEVSDAARLVKSPLVSVLMVAYNQADYLADAIEGVISQQCDFSFELVIGEDASSDETKEIALDYQRRYPAIIRVVHSTANVGAGANFQRIVSKARGEYVAFCDGDDYWCVTYKLAGEVRTHSARSRCWGCSHGLGSITLSRVAGWIVRSGQIRGTGVFQEVSLKESLFSTFHYPKILRSCTVLFRRSTVLDCAVRSLAAKSTSLATSCWRHTRHRAGRWPTCRKSPRSTGKAPIRHCVPASRPGSISSSPAWSLIPMPATFLPIARIIRKPIGGNWSWALFLWSISARDAATAKVCTCRYPCPFRRDQLRGRGLARVLIMRRHTLRRQRRNSDCHARR